MRLIEHYANAILSFVFIVLTIILFYLASFGDHYFQTSTLVFVLIPLLGILGVAFAVRSKKQKESSYVGNTLLIIGIITLICVVYLYAVTFLLATGCGYGGC
jgi:hypothetical protein